MNTCLFFLFVLSRPFLMETGRSGRKKEKLLKKGLKFTLRGVEESGDEVIIGVSVVRTWEII